MMMKCAVIVITINSNTLYIARSNWGDGGHIYMIAIVDMIISERGWK